MIAHWMGYALLVSAALAALALAADHALRLYGRPTRWLWATSLLGALVVPVLAFLRAPVPGPAVDIGVPMTMPAILPGSAAAATPVAPAPFYRDWLTALSTHGDDILLGLWLVGTVLLVAWALVSYLRLRRERQDWHEREVDGLKVLVSESAGPAVVGLRRSRVVLPAWVLSEPEPRRRMIVTHEAEHVAAGDPQLLATACGALLLAPWNPLVWWQLRRLRLAAELDCDARVLRRGMDLRGYAGLLLDVGERFGRAPLAAAFAEPRSVLARRLAALTARKPARRALRAACGSVLALVVVGIAGAAPLPERPALSVAAGTSSEATAKEKHTVVVIDSAGNYYVGEFSDAGNSGGTDVPECAAARRSAPGGQAACDARLIGLIKETMTRNPDRGIVYTRVSSNRPYQEVVHVMEAAKRAGASMVAALSGKEAAGLKRVQAPEGAAEPTPPAAGRAMQQEKPVILEILPGPSYRVNGESVAAKELTPYLRKLYANRPEKVIFVKADGQVLYRDVIAGMDAARSAGIKVIGAALPGGVKVTGDEIVPTPPPPPPPPDQPLPAGVQVFTPYTVAPELINRDTIRKALEKNYPPLLKQAGVGGMVLVWALVNEQGAVPSALLGRTSGRAELDDAALKVTRMMRFTPARNRDEVVKVWIKLPIVFKTSADGKSVLPAAPGAPPPPPRPAKVPEDVPAKVPEAAPVKVPEDVPAKVPEAAPVKVPEDVTPPPPPAGKIRMGQARPADAPSPPPPPAVQRVTAQAIAAGPTFTPYTVAPDLINRETVRKALEENYPPLLRSAGVGGIVMVWALIDEQGGVPKTAVKKGSGHAELDDAALNVARVMRFTPAKNGPDVVKAWVTLPIVFRTESEKAPAAKDTAGKGSLNQKL